MSQNKEPDGKWQTLVLVTGILLIAMNLRPAITALSPLAERMHAAGLSRSLIGSLTTVPLILFGAVGLWAGWIGQRLGFARALGLGLAVLALGCFLRSHSGDDVMSWRIGGTILIGAGIALGNVLLPGLVKSRFPNHVGLMTSLYATAMNLGAASGIAFAVPLANRLAGGWNAALASWGIFALAILLVWSPQMWPRPAARARKHPLAGVLSLARQKRAWQITIYMGMQSTVFYSTVAWLPTVLQERGMGENEAAYWVTALQLMGCVASLIIPTLAGRRESQSFWIVGCTGSIIVGLTGVLALPVALTIYPVLLLGIGLNGGFGMVLLIIALRSKSPDTAASLSSMAQAGGYLLSAPGPWLVGWLSTHGGWNVAFGLIIFLAMVATIFGFLAGRSGELAMEGE